MGRPNQARLALWCMVLSCLALSACIGRGRNPPATTTTSVATTSAGIADLAPATLPGAGGGAATGDQAVPTPAPRSVSGPDDGAAAPGRGLSTPEAAARNLWDAWRDADWPRAMLYASAPAVDTLMEAVWGPEIRRSGCTVIEAGHLCRFEGPTRRWDLQISGSPVAGFRVDLVTGGDPAGVNLDELSGAPVPGVADTRPDGSPAETAVPPDTGSGETVPSTTSPVKRRAKRATTTVAATAQTPPGTPEPGPAPVPIPASAGQGAPAPVPVASPDQNPQ